MGYCTSTVTPLCRKKYIYKKMRTRVIDDGAHVGHGGVMIRVERIRRSVLPPGLETDVREYKTFGAFDSTQKFQQTSMGFVSHLPMTAHGKDCICAIANAVTKVCSLYSGQVIGNSARTLGTKRLWDISTGCLQQRSKIYEPPMKGADGQARCVQLNLSLSHHPPMGG